MRSSATAVRGGADLLIAEMLAPAAMSAEAAFVEVETSAAEFNYMGMLPIVPVLSLLRFVLE